MKLLNLKCDGCDTEIAKDVPEDTDLESIGVHTLKLTSRSVDGTKTVHLDGECLDAFMDGSLSGNDLFLQD